MADKRIQVQINGDSSNFESAANRSRTAIDNLTGAASAFTAGISAMGLTMLARDLIDAGVAADKMRNSMAAATGSSAQGAAEMQFIRAEAARLGLDLQSTADAYGKLAAAAKGTATEGQGARDIFSAVAEASTSLGLSADQSAGAFTAIGQMISKGTVSAEELRGQLVERLPGAVNIAARAMGVTTSELDGMLKKGEVITSDFLPKFAIEIKKSFGVSEEAAHSAQAEINRFKTSLFDLKVLVMEQGGNDSLKMLASSATTLATALRSVVLEIKEAKIHWADMLGRAGIMMGGSQGGLLSLLTKEGRAEMRAELAAHDKMYQWQLENLSKMRTVNAVSSPAAATAAAAARGGAGGKPSRATGTRTSAAFFGRAWDEADRATDFDRAAGTSFNTELAPYQTKASPFSLLGPGGAEGLMAEVAAYKEIKLEAWKWSEERLIGQRDLAVAIYEDEANRYAEYEQLKRDVTTGTFNYMSQTASTFFQLSGNRSKTAFEIYRATSAASTLVGTYEGAQKAFNDGAKINYWVGVAYAASATAAGLARVAAIYSTNPGSRGGAIGGTGSIGGSPSSLVTPTSTGSSSNESPLSITIHVEGNLIGEERWVEEKLAPTIKELSTRRNVDFGFAAA